MNKNPDIGSFTSAKDIYIVEKEYAVGGMGITYLVVSQKTNQRMILKQLRLDLVSDWKMVELFEREAEVLRQLDHPRIPKYIDYFSAHENKHFCLVQSFVDGRTMQTMIDSDVPVSLSEFKSYLTECLEILDYLHALVPPVIHRDITPKNIIISHGHAYLVDFGSVKSKLNPEAGSATTIGTFGYMPPEQMMGRAEAGSDIYSLGMSFIALATHTDPSDLPLNEKTGQVETSNVLKNLPKPMHEALELMTRMGLQQRLNSASEAIKILIRKENTVKAPAPMPLAAKDIFTMGMDMWRQWSSTKKTLLAISGMMILFVLSFFNVKVAPVSDMHTKDAASEKEIPKKIITPDVSESKKETVNLAVNLDKQLVDSVLLSGVWQGHDGSSKMELYFVEQKPQIKAYLISYSEREQSYTGPKRNLNVVISESGSILMKDKNVNDGVSMETTYYGDLTENLDQIVGSFEIRYFQNGSEYMEAGRWYFRIKK